MPAPSFSVSIEIHAQPDAVFAFVADLSKHGEWAANELRVEALDNVPLGAGKKYRSKAKVRGREFAADLVITEIRAPTIFAFAGSDATGKFSHRFTLEPTVGGTRVTRTVQFDLSPLQYLFYWAALHSVRLPAANKALTKLKKQLEK